MKPGKGPVPWPDFLDQDTAVAGSEKVDHSAGHDRLGKPGGGLLNCLTLPGDSFQQPLATLDPLLPVVRLVFHRAVFFLGHVVHL
jgi:hypothetical protein